jgi:hypothetical protein
MPSEMRRKPADGLKKENRNLDPGRSQKALDVFEKKSVPFFCSPPIEEEGR